MTNIPTEQMEFGIRNQIRNNYRNAGNDRQKRSRWWFAQMRRVVDFALPPQSMASPRPEQTYLRLK